MSTSSREFSAGVQLRTEGDFVVPAALDDADPGACEDRQWREGADIHGRSPAGRPASPTRRRGGCRSRNP